ncbi:MAG: AMP-binding protein [Paracoccaceae bacterium]
MTPLGDRFRGHHAARIAGAAPTQAGIASVIADRPAAVALRQALAASAAGVAFRIGEGGPPPAPSTLPLFETLTSGTSGQPRRIRRSHASWIASFAVNARLFGIGPGVRVAVLGRLLHSLSLYGALEALHLGADLHLLDGLRPDRQRAALAGAAVQILYATPAQLRLLLEAGGPALPDLRFVLVGGSKLDATLRAGLQNACPNADLREFYGAAEASFITLAGADTPAGSVGAAYPGVQIEVRDCLAGIGQIWVKSPYLAEGYATIEPTGAQWQDGWLSVGEMGEIRAGYLFLAGRAGRMVTIADQNVFPAEIEDFMLTLQGVTRVAVLARKDPLRGHMLAAVAMGDPTQTATIFAALRARYGPLKAPRTLHWRTDWPQLAAGKTDLVALERAYP